MPRPEEVVATLLPTMFSALVPAETMNDFDAEDVRDVLPRIDVPTLLLYGDRDVRAPRAVAEALQASIDRRLRLVMLPGVGHVRNVEAPEEFNAAVRDFLRNRH